MTNKRPHGMNISDAPVGFVRPDKAPPAPPKAARKPMPAMVDRVCAHCGGPFKARAADVKRGWGLFCHKSCKARAQEASKGLFKAMVDGRRADNETMHLQAMDGATTGWDEGGWKS